MVGAALKIERLLNAQLRYLFIEWEERSVGTVD
jgi:hypothetical protein